MWSEIGCRFYVVVTEELSRFTGKFFGSVVARRWRELGRHRQFKRRGGLREELDLAGHALCHAVDEGTRSPWFACVAARQHRGRRVLQEPLDARAKCAGNAHKLERGHPSLAGLDLGEGRPIEARLGCELILRSAGFLASECDSTTKLHGILVHSVRF